MQPVNKLGFRVAGISAVVVLVLFGAFTGIRALVNRAQTPLVTPTPVVTPTSTNQLLSQQDSDNDGLPDQLEPMYRTDPVKPDTDSDGTNDGAEIEALRNPIVAGPNDQLVSDDVNKNAVDENSFTNKYLNTLPKNASRTDVLSREKLQAFVDQARQQFTVSAYTPAVKTAPGEGKTAIEAYLNSVSSAQNDKLKAVSSDDITQAWQAAIGRGNSGLINDIVSKLASNLAILKDVSAPAEATTLHKQFLAASEALLNNVKLLQNMKTDFVGGLIGAKNIEELGSVFNDIAKQISDLETKYGLK